MSKVTTVILGITAIALGIVFEKVNVAFMVGLAFAIAASANFPVLLLSMYWKGLTTRGAFVGGFLGLISAVTLTVLSPSIWELVLLNPKGSAPVGYNAPALFTVPLAFLGCWLFSKLDHSRSAASEGSAFMAQYIRSQTGIGADSTAIHNELGPVGARAATGHSRPPP